MRLARALSVIVPLSLGWVLACGGRFEQTVGDGADTSGSGGTTSSSGATTSGGTATSHGGTPTNHAGAATRGGTGTVGGAPGIGGTAVITAGTASIGGTTSVAGSGPTLGGACNCPAIACGPGSQPVPNPNGCCFTCQPLPDVCAQQRATYDNFRAAVIDKFSSLGCMTDADCTMFVDKNPCGLWCPVPLPAAAIGDAYQVLDSQAQTTCSAMCPFFAPPCAVTSAPACLMNRCIVGI